jgi:hypothetical protein
LVLSSLVLVACGGESSAESEIKESIEASQTANDPSNCAALTTPNFREQISKETGFDALDTCEERASEGKGAESVDISNVEVDRETATADVALTGGSFDGQELETELALQNGQWKLNKITGFASFDQAEVIETLGKGFAGPSIEADRSRAACVGKSLEEASRPKLEEALLSETPGEFEELTESCS